MPRVRVGDRFTMNCGSAIDVISRESSLSSLVRFMDTGYETLATDDRIIGRSIKDKLMPSVCGVGFIGDGVRSQANGGIELIAYNRWRGMINRCYNDLTHKTQPSYMGCEVSEEWQDFQNFAEWFIIESKGSPEGLELDKDIKCKGNKIYSEDTCSLVSCQENIEAAHSKLFTLTSPCGEVVEMYNMNKFCRENNLDTASMHKVWQGKRKSHKGWTK